MGLIVIVALILGGGWGYQNRGSLFKRDQTPAGEATAESEATPIATTPTELLIDARPWGQLEEVRNTADGVAITIPAGSPFTPRLITVPPGSYEAVVKQKGGASRTCKVEVVVGQQATCEVRFSEVEPRVYFKEFGW
jgi:hypothetical protein